MQFSLTFSSQVDLNFGLVGYFPFNGNVDDESTYSIDGLNNNVIFTSGINGNENSAIRLNGIDANIIASDDTRDIIDSLTVSVRIKN